MLQTNFWTAEVKTSQSVAERGCERAVGKIAFPNSKQKKILLKNEKMIWIHIDRIQQIVPQD